MELHGWPALYAIAVWWFSTGVIIYLDGLPRRTFKWSMLGATALFAASLWGMVETRDDTSLRGAYLAFTFGVLAWGWQEVSFYMGYVTGPRREPCPEGCRGLPHFGHAIQTSLYHELAIIGSAALVAWATWGGANRVAWWTFLVMWWMHQSAKLNVFLGVRNLNEEFLPDHLRFLRSFLTKRPMNLLFPVSVTVSTVVAAIVLGRSFGSEVAPFEAVACLFVGGLMVLAILEHWFLVLPLPAAALWNWGLKSRAEIRPASIEIVAGFLGAGKTTYLRRRLAEADPDVRTLVLVNDFAKVGVDGTLLKGLGSEVVELPNGCLCCSLRDDLARQLRELVARFSPDRILLEPSGAAETGSLLAVLSRAELAAVVRDVRVVTLVDAGAFLADYARLPGFFQAQAQLAPVVLLNKADQVTAAELQTIEDTIRSLNPDTRILPSRYGKPLHGEVSLSVLTIDGKEQDHPESGHAESPALGLSSWSAALEGCYDEQRLREQLEAMAGGNHGAIVRAKGIARVRRGWVHFDLAGGRVTVAGLPGVADDGRAVAIGTELDEPGLHLGFQRCRVEPRIEHRLGAPLSVLAG